MPTKDSSIISQTIIKATADVVSGQGGDFAAVASEIAGVYLNTLELIADTEPAQQAPQTNGGGARPAVATAGGTVNVKNQSGLDPVDYLPAACPECGGTEVWDNRKDLPQYGGSRNPKSPHFKCANKSCGHGFWPPR